MKVFGHPLHVVLVHFPAALLPMDFVCSLLGYLTGHTLFLAAAFCALVGGVATGLLAAVPGLVDLAAIPSSQLAAQRNAFLHAGFNVAVVVVFAVLAVRAWKQYPSLAVAGPGLLALKGGLVLLLIVGNYFGGNLVWRYRVGLDSSAP